MLSSYSKTIEPADEKKILIEAELFCSKPQGKSLKYNIKEKICMNLTTRVQMFLLLCTLNIFYNENEQMWYQ